MSLNTTRLHRLLGIPMRGVSITSSKEPAPEPYGLCADYDPEIWFPPLDVNHRRERIIKTQFAQLVCAQCPRRTLCLEDAMTLGRNGGPVDDGIWAGIDFSERTARRRAVNEAKRRTA